MTDKGLYIHREIIDSAGLVLWMKQIGVVDPVRSSSLHTTQAYSRKSVETPPHDDPIRVRNGHRSLEQFDQGAFVLKIAAPYLSARHAQLMRMGATFDYPEYVPHITLSYSEQSESVQNAPPYDGEILLGGEIHEDLEDHRHSNMDLDENAT